MREEMSAPRYRLLSPAQVGVRHLPVFPSSLPTEECNAGAQVENETCAAPFGRGETTSGTGRHGGELGSDATATAGR